MTEDPVPRTECSVYDLHASGRWLWVNVIRRAVAEADGDIRLRVGRGETQEQIRRDAIEWLTRDTHEHTIVKEEVLRNGRPDHVRITCSCGATVHGFELDVDDAWEDHRSSLRWVCEQADVDCDKVLWEARRRYGKRLELQPDAGVAGITGVRGEGV